MKCPKCGEDLGAYPLSSNYDYWKVKQWEYRNAAIHIKNCQVEQSETAREQLIRGVTEGENET